MSCRPNDKLENIGSLSQFFLIFFGGVKGKHAKCRASFKLPSFTGSKDQSYEVLNLHTSNAASKGIQSNGFHESEVVEMHLIFC